MNVLLSDGRQVPVSLAPWAREMRDCLIRLQAQPKLVDVGDLRKLLAYRPNHYLGGDWEGVIERAALWIDRAERALPAMHPAALVLAQAGEPLAVSEHGPVGCAA